MATKQASIIYKRPERRVLKNTVKVVADLQFVLYEKTPSFCITFKFLASKNLDSCYCIRIAELPPEDCIYRTLKISVC